MIFYLGIPTVSTRAGNLLKVYCYAPDEPHLNEIADWLHTWSSLFEAEAGRIIWFGDIPAGSKNHLLLKTFSEQDKRSYGPVMNLTDCDAADTFSNFAEQLRVDGFAFLHQRMKAGFLDGPILVAVDDRRIVGAIGPLGILLDPIGTPTQPPQYFAVHPDYRNRGHGRALWRAAMAWGFQHGAVYKVLQAASGSAAERLYISEDLSTLGYMCSKDLTLATADTFPGC